jgi:hypothetical protein
MREQLPSWYWIEKYFRFEITATLTPSTISIQQTATLKLSFNVSLLCIDDIQLTYDESLIDIIEVNKTTYVIKALQNKQDTASITITASDLCHIQKAKIVVNVNIEEINLSKIEVFRNNVITYKFDVGDDYTHMIL